MTERIWLDVPFAQKDAAKRAGAKWDNVARRWYAPREGIDELAPWSAAPDLAELLPGEDRTLGNGLFVDLVPSSCWFTNVRFCVSQRDWERLRRMVTRRAGMRCEICGAGENRDARRWLEVHERWLFHDETHTQRLARLICLCTDCHTVTHFGYAQIKGMDSQALAHLMRVTGMSERSARSHVEDAFALWRIRSQAEWTLDLGILTDAGITLQRPPAADERAVIAVSQTSGEHQAADSPPAPVAAAHAYVDETPPRAQAAADAPPRPRKELSELVRRWIGRGGR